MNKDDPAIGQSLELLEKHLPQTEDALWLNPPAQAKCPSPHSCRFWQPHFAANHLLKRNGWQALEASQTKMIPQQHFSLVVLFASKHKQETLALLQAANCWLKPEGRLLFTCPNDYGAKSYAKIFQEEGRAFNLESGRKSRLYFLFRSEKLAPKPLVDSQQIKSGLWSCPGLFSWAKPDRGSILLAQALQNKKLAGPVADLGAGIGYLGTVLAKPLELHLFEEDERALICAEQNLNTHKLSTHWCDLSDLASWPQAAPTSFATVITNPPFHSGKKENQKLGQLFIQLAHRLLSNDGSLWLVGNTHLGYPKMIKSLFSKIDIKTEQEGFTVLEAVK